jgi:hypothetical protein
MRRRPVTASLDIEAAATLFAGLGEVHQQLAERQAQLADLADAISNPETAGISFLGSQAPYAVPKWGPALGHSWFVQLVTVGPLNSGDTLALYRGMTTLDNQPQRKKIEWLGTNGTWQQWTPGRTGFWLRGGKDSVVFDGGSGTLTSATRYFVNIDVIDVADRALAMFLV